MQYLAHFIDAIHQNDLKRAANNVQDLLAEPYRAGLLPNFDEVTKTLKNTYNVLASGISGSGPTMFAIVDDSVDKQVVKKYLEKEYCNINGQNNGFVVLAEADVIGAHLLN